MTAACILVGVLVLLAAGLVIYNILKISITKRIKEYGTRAIAMENEGKIYRLVSLQLFDSRVSRYSYRFAARYIVGKRCIDWRLQGLLNPDSVHGKQHFRIELCNQHRQYGKTTDALCQYRSHTSVCSAGCLSCCPVRITMYLLLLLCRGTDCEKSNAG